MLENIFESISILELARAGASYIAWILVFIFVVLGIILNYHWKEYAATFVPVQMFRALYFVVGGIIILTMFGAKAMM